MLNWHCVMVCQVAGDFQFHRRHNNTLPVLLFYTEKLHSLLNLHVLIPSNSATCPSCNAIQQSWCWRLPTWGPWWVMTSLPKLWSSSWWPLKVIWRLQLISFIIWAFTFIPPQVLHWLSWEMCWNNNGVFPQQHITIHDNNKPKNIHANTANTTSATRKTSQVDLQVHPNGNILSSSSGTASKQKQDDVAQIYGMYNLWYQLSSSFPPLLYCLLPLSSSLFPPSSLPPFSYLPLLSFRIVPSLPPFSSSSLLY